MNHVIVETSKFFEVKVDNIITKEICTKLRERFLKKIELENNDDFQEIFSILEIGGHVSTCKGWIDIVIDYGDKLRIDFLGSLVDNYVKPGIHTEIFIK